MLSSWTITMLGLTVFCLTFQYILGPILVRSKTSQPVSRSYVELPVEYPLIKLPQSFPQKLYELECLGFSLIGYLALGADQTRVNGILSVLVNRESRTIATVASLFARSLGDRVATTHFVEFTTEFDDGSEINTINSPTVRVFRAVPKKTIMRVPNLWNTGSLYRVHCYLLEHEAERTAILPASGDELKHLRASMAEAFKQQAELGYYFLDEAAQRYRLTWSAAFTTCWRLLWPAKQIIQFHQSRAGRRLAQAAGVRY